MAILLKVGWADVSGQSELHQHTRHIGGASGRLTWKHTQGQAIEFIEKSIFEYYLEHGD